MGCAFTKKYQGKEDHGGLLITKEVKEIFFFVLQLLQALIK